MNSGRRLAAVVLAAALSLGAIGVTAGPAEAKDTSWPARHSGTTNSDTSWPTNSDTSWPTLADTSWPTLTDTSWPS